MSIFNSPDRMIKEFKSDALDDINDYCNKNFVSMPCTGSIDVCIGGFQVWLTANNFEIVDKQKDDSTT